ALGELQQPLAAADDRLAAAGPDHDAAPSKTLLRSVANRYASPRARRYFLVIELGKISGRRSCRLRLDVRPASRCRLFAWLRFSLPLPVTRNRFRTLLLVLAFGIANSDKEVPPAGRDRRRPIRRAGPVWPGQSYELTAGRAGEVTPSGPASPSSACLPSTAPSRPWPRRPVSRACRG